MQLRLLIDNNFHSKTHTFANFFQESQFQLVQNPEIHFALRVLPLFPCEALLTPDPLPVGKPLDLSAVYFRLFSCHLKLIMTMFSICKLEPNNIIPSEKKASSKVLLWQCPVAHYALLLLLGDEKNLIFLKKSYAGCPSVFLHKPHSWLLHLACFCPLV